MPFDTFDDSSSGIDGHEDLLTNAKARGMRQLEELATTKRAESGVIASIEQSDNEDAKQTAIRQIEQQAMHGESRKDVALALTHSTQSSAELDERTPTSAPPGAYRVIVLSAGLDAGSCGRGPEQPRPINEDSEDPDDVNTLTAVVVDETEERQKLEQAARESVVKSAAQAEVVDVKRRRCVAGIVVSLVLVVIITLTVLLTEKSNTKVLTASPTLSPTVNYVEPSEWVGFANEITLSPYGLSYPVTANSTTEEKALAWFIDEGAMIPERSATQRFAFVVMAFAMNVPDWTIESGFDECALKGVTCNSNHSAIEIDLTAGGLKGSIPDDIALLSNMRKMVYWDNFLTGTVPWDLMMTHMTDMNFLDIDLNKLTGTLPDPKPGSWQKLEVLWAYGNKFTGTLSPGFSNWPMLHDLYVRDNELTGTVPSALGNITAMKWFAIDDNKFHGSLPTEIGLWTNINHFEVEGNGEMTGTIPTEVGQWTAVKSFFCHSNKFVGMLPTGIENFTNLVRFRVHLNGFTGPIPSALGGWTNLKEFHIYNNAFTGPLPQGMSNWTELEEFKVNNNKLTGEIPDGLESWTDLLIGQFQVNSLNGTAQSFCEVASNETVVTADCCEVSCPCCTSCFSDEPDQNCVVLS